MDLMEITEKERLSREDAAARLHALADMLAKHNDVEFDRGGMHFKVHVPDEVDFKLEIEIEDDKGRSRSSSLVSETPSDAPGLLRTRPEVRAERLGYALRSLAAELVDERHRVAELRREVAELRARLESLKEQHPVANEIARRK